MAMLPVSATVPVLAIVSVLARPRPQATNNARIPTITQKIMLRVANFISIHVLPALHGYRIRVWLYRLAGVKIAEDVKFLGGSYFVTPRVSIGAGSSIARACRFSALAPAIITIGERVGIGTRAIILDGTEIGKGCIIAAGAVVRGTFDDNMLIAGVPARRIRQLE